MASLTATAQSTLCTRLTETAWTVTAPPIPPL
jgi:hypothetical protein